MSDYLGHLVARWLNPDKAIQPRPISLFELAAKEAGWPMSDPAFDEETEIEAEQEADEMTFARPSPTVQAAKAPTPSPTVQVAKAPTPSPTVQAAKAPTPSPASHPPRATLRQPPGPVPGVYEPAEASLEIADPDPPSSAGPASPGTAAPKMPPPAGDSGGPRQLDASESLRPQAKAERIVPLEIPRSAMAGGDAAARMPDDMSPSEPASTLPDREIESARLAAPSAPPGVARQDRTDSLRSPGKPPQGQPGGPETATERDTSPAKVQPPNRGAGKRISPAPSLRPASPRPPPWEAADPLAAEEPVALPEEAQPSVPVTVRPQVRRYVERTPPALAVPAVTPEPAPAIQVTIGRIEVRATPPPVPSTEARRPTPAIMTLDEYLRRRTRGDNR